MATATVPQDKVAQKAYEIFKARGEKPGRDLDDWLQAEKELTHFESKAPALSSPQKKNHSSSGRNNYSY